MLWQPQCQTSPDHGKHLFMYWSPRGAGGIDSDCNSVALVSHLDTVYPAEVLGRAGHSWSPFASEADPPQGAVGEICAARQGPNWVRGPGTIDIHGGTIAAIASLAALRAEQPDLFASAGWHLWLNAAEEEMVPCFGPAAERFMRATGTAPAACGSWRFNGASTSAGSSSEADGDAAGEVPPQLLLKLPPAPLVGEDADELPDGDKPLTALQRKQLHPSRLAAILVMESGLAQLATGGDQAASAEGGHGAVARAIEEASSGPVLAPGLAASQFMDEPCDECDANPHGAAIALQSARLVAARPGMRVQELSFQGTEAHAGNAHSSGASALLAAARATEAIESVVDSEPKLGGITANVGRLEGGTTHNTVPGAARAEYEIRGRDPESFFEALRRSDDAVTRAIRREQPGGRGQQAPPVAMEARTVTQVRPWAPLGEALDGASGARVAGDKSLVAPLEDVQRTFAAEPKDPESHRAMAAAVLELANTVRLAGEDLLSLAGSGSAGEPRDSPGSAGRASSGATADSPQPPPYFRVELQRRGGLSDANNLGHLAPALDGFGPVGANAHKAGGARSYGSGEDKEAEFLCADTLVPKCGLLQGVLERLVRAPPASATRRELGGPGGESPVDFGRGR